MVVSQVKSDYFWFRHDQHIFHPIYSDIKGQYNHSKSFVWRKGRRDTANNEIFWEDIFKCPDQVLRLFLKETSFFHGNLWTWAPLSEISFFCLFFFIFLGYIWSGYQVAYILWRLNRLLSPILTLKLWRYSFFLGFQVLTVSFLYFLKNYILR